MAASRSETHRNSREARLHILVLGGAGMVGRKFIERLARDGALGGKPVRKVIYVPKRLVNIVI